MDENYLSGLLDQQRSRLPASPAFGADLTQRQPPGVRWKWAHSKAFDVRSRDSTNTPDDQRWHSGHVEAICAIGRSALVGSNNGGIWLVNPSFDAVPADKSFPATPISMSWRNPSIRSMARMPGADYPLTVFAGLEDVGPEYLVAISVKTIVGGIEVTGRRAIQPPVNSGIWSIAFVGSSTLIVGTPMGVWWAEIDADPNSIWVPAWKAAAGFTGHVISLTAGPDRSVLAGVEPPGPAGVWRGTWTSGVAPTLVFTQTLPTTGRTSVAACENDRKIAYAVAALPDGTLGSVWRSADGGASWSQISAPQNAGNQGNDWNNCIAVHPRDSNIVAIGWRTGPFLRDGATGKWELRTDEPNGHMHGDVHTLLFAQSGDELQLWAGTDGGICLSLDLGRQWDSRYNRHLLTPQVYSTLGHTLEEYGLPPSNTYERDNSCFHVSPTDEGIFGAATQDNGVLISRNTSAGDTSLWRIIGGDGQAVLFAGENLIFHSNNTQNRLRMSRLLAGGVNDGDGEIVPVDGKREGLPKLALASAHKPSHVLEKSRVLGVAGGANELLALLEPASRTDVARLKTVGTIPEVISCVATLTGEVALVGSVGGHLYLVDLASGAVTNEQLPSNSPRPVKRVRWRGPDHMLAILGNDRIFRRTSTGWVQLPGPPLDVHDVDGDPEIANGTLFAATRDGVFASSDLGQTWADCSEGLPTRLNGRAIFVTDTGGMPTVYLATYGWGIFRASLAAKDTVVIPPLDKEMERILFGIVQDGGGVEIVNGRLKPSPPRGPARELALAMVINILASRLDFPAAAEFRARSAELVRQLAAGAGRRKTGPS